MNSMTVPDVYALVNLMGLYLSDEFSQIYVTWLKIFAITILFF